MTNPNLYVTTASSRKNFLEIVEKLMSASSPIERAKWKKELELHDLVDEEIRHSFSDPYNQERYNSILSTIEEKQKIDELWELKNGSFYNSSSCGFSQKRYRNIDQVHKDISKVCKELEKAKSKGDYDKVKEYYGCLKNLHDKVSDIIWS